MLRVYPGLDNSKAQASGAGPARISVEPRDVVQLLRRSAWPILACSVVALAAAGAYIAVSAPRFVARAQILIEPQRPQVFWHEPGMIDLTIDNAQVESQLEVLRSEKIAAAVIDSLGLASDPEFQERLPKSWFGAKPPGSAAGEPAMPGGAADLRRSRAAITAFAGRLSARRLGQSYVIEIAYDSGRPEQASRIANAITDAYMHDQIEAKAQVARLGSAWLQSRIEEVRAQLHQASRAVEEFKTRNALVDTTGRGLLIEQQLAETNSQLVAARAQTGQAAARLARIREVSAQDTGASVGEVLNNQVMTNLRQRLQDAVSRQAELRQRYGRPHEAVLSAHQEIVEINRSLSNELQRIGQVYLSDFEIAKSRERDIEAQIRTLVQEAERGRSARVTLSEMESEAQSYRKMYQSLLEKRMETAQKATLPVSSARVISPATTPLGKSSPNGKLILALAGTTALLVGLGIGIGRSSFDRTLRSPACLDALGIRCLGVLPELPARRGGGKPGTVDLVSDQFSAFGRALEKLRVSVEHASTANKPFTTLGVTSVLQREGKSTVALELALAFARTGRRTLLLDASSCGLGHPARQGLVPASQARTGEMAHPALEPEVESLFLGVDRAVVRPGATLHGPAMAALLERLASVCEIVLVDLPAMTSSAAARAFGAHLDAEILVAEWGRVRSAELQQAVEAIAASGVEVLGVAVNRCRDPAMVARTF